jgi:hypothetical protein
MAKITDPDSLAQTTDIVFDTAAKTIEVKSTGAISATGSSANNGVTLQCLYSFAKEEWRTDANLIKFRFPFVAITAEQFELVDGWTFLNASSEQLIRDAGWAVRNTSGNIVEMWANITTLGAFDAATDLAYYQQEVDGASTDIAFAGEVNQAVQIVDDPNGDGNYVDGFDYRTYFKIFLREENKTFDSYELISEQSPTDEAGLTQMTYRKYALPLSNGTDLNYVESDANIGTITPYTDIDIEYLVGNNFYTTDQGTYAVDDVVQDGAGRWYICTGAGTVDATDYADLGTMGGAGTATFSAYSGERLINGVYYAFNVIVDGNVDGTGNNALKQEIYEKVQYSLRQATDIDAGAGSVIGKTADDLLFFEGDTLKTQPGVYIDDFNSADTNSLEFADVNFTGTYRTFPFVAAGDLLFNDVIQGDTTAKYWLFFTNDDAGTNAGNDFDTSGAIIIDDNSGTDITGDVSGQASISFDYDYDNNVQRGAGSDATDVPYTGIVIGAEAGGTQHVLTTGTIIRSTANTVNFVGSLERVYLNP